MGEAEKKGELRDAEPLTLSIDQRAGGRR